LGAYAPEEFDRPQPEPAFAGTTVEHEPVVETKVEVPPAPTAREQINRDVPMDAPKKPLADSTPKAVKLPPWQEYLESLQLAFRDCRSSEDVSQVIGSPLTQEALKTYKDLAKRRLDDIIAHAIGQHSRKTDDETQLDQQADAAWPGEEPVSRATEDA
jgi:hypothetical protein